MTGIGFLGAGVIFKEGITVRGLTTAASIWITSAIGVIMGSGLYFPAVAGTVLTLGVLVGVPVDGGPDPVAPVRHHRLRFERGKVMPEEAVRELLARHGCSAAALAWRITDDGRYFEYRMTIRTNDETNFARLARALEALPGGARVHPLARGRLSAPAAAALAPRGALLQNGRPSRPVLPTWPSAPSPRSPSRARAPRPRGGRRRRAAPWEGAPFSARPAALLAAAEALAAAEGGRRRRAARGGPRTASTSAARATVRAPRWSSGCSPPRRPRELVAGRAERGRPGTRRGRRSARASITAGGDVHVLDPATLSEQGGRDARRGVLGPAGAARRRCRRTRAGAVVEQLVTLRDNAPFFDAGVSAARPRRAAQPGAPVRARGRPAALPLRWVVRGGRLAPRERVAAACAG